MVTSWKSFFLCLIALFLWASHFHFDTSKGYLAFVSLNYADARPRPYYRKPKPTSYGSKITESTYKSSLRTTGSSASKIRDNWMDDLDTPNRSHNFRGANEFYWDENRSFGKELLRLLLEYMKICAPTVIESYHDQNPSICADDFSPDEIREVFIWANLSEQKIERVQTSFTLNKPLSKPAMPTTAEVFRYQMPIKLVDTFPSYYQHKRRPEQHSAAFKLYLLGCISLIALSVMMIDRLKQRKPTKFC